MRYFIVLMFVFQLFSLAIHGQESQPAELFKKYPTLLTNFASLVNEAGESKIVFQRSDLLEAFSASQMNVDSQKLQINKTAITILDVKGSAGEITDFYKRNAKMPLIIYQWEVTVENAGEYLAVSNLAIGSEGFLNQDRLVVLNQGVISLAETGLSKVKLNKGKNIFTIRALCTSDRGFNVYSTAALEKVQNEVTKKISSNTKEDVEWFFSSFLPYFATLKLNCGNHIVSLLKKEPYKSYLKKDSAVLEQVLKIIQSCKNDADAFAIEEYIWLNHQDLYFLLNKKENKPDSFNGLVYQNQSVRTKFLEQLIYNGRIESEKKYFEACEKFFEASADIKDKQKSIAKLYADRFLYYYRIGRVRDSYDVFKITDEKVKPFSTDLKYVNYTLQNYRDALLVREEDIVSLNSFDEVKGQSILEIVENYEGKEDSLSKAFTILNSLNKNLIKSNTTIYSLPSFFRLALEQNQKFKADFKKFCAEKAETQIAKAKESRDIKLLAAVLERYDGILDMAEIRYMLVEEYFIRGGLFQALDYIKILTQSNQEYLNKIINRKMMLEEISKDNKNSLPLKDEQLKTSIKLKGSQTTIEKNYVANKTENKIVGPGKFLKAIALPSPHIQYRSHIVLDQVQPIEPIFTQDRIVINGGSYLLNYAAKENAVTWSYQSNNEFKKNSEPGPFQKQFATEQNGNRLFIMTNKDNSEQKTFKSFDLSGQLLFDISERNESLDEEPVCTPVVHEGKAFCISYSNNETINSFHFSTFDAQTGAFINKVPLSSIPEKVLDYNSYPFPKKWNTFTHDQHFFKEGSAIYGFSGTGVIFKANATTGCIDWAKGVAKSSFYHNGEMDFEYGFSPSGYVKTFSNVLVTLTPDIQLFTGWDKNSGAQLWKTKNLRPLYIHGRNNNEAVYFSDLAVNDETNLYRINAKTGELDFQVSTRGLRITGEGVVIGKKIYLPSQNSMIVFNKDTGEYLGKNDLPFFAVKIRSEENFLTIFSSNTCYIFNLDGNWASDKIVSNENANATSIYKDPTGALEHNFHFDNLRTEITLKIPEAIFAGTDYWKKTKIIKTNKPFHFIMIANNHIALFRESFKSNNNQYMPPEILWYGQYESFCVDKDSLWVYEQNKISEYDLYSRVLKRSMENDAKDNPISDKKEKVAPIIAVSEQYIAIQCKGNAIRVYDKKSLKLFTEVYSPVVRSICVSDQYLITMSISSVVKCFSFEQNNAEIWTVSHNNRADIVIEKDVLVFSKYSDASTLVIDLKTGKQKIQVKPFLGSMIYTMNNWAFDGNWFFAYNMLYDVATGAPHPKLRECYSVSGGGTIGFTKQYGQEGLYVADGKEYGFTTRSTRNHNNFAATALRKNNLLFLATPWWLETFEIKNDQLVLIEALKLNSGYIGEGQFPKDMQYLFLERSLLIAKNDEMYFLKNIDLNFKTESIDSFRVENIKQSEWPYSELYPDVECNSENWVSCEGNNPERKISYSAFADSRTAYLKLVISPSNRKGLRDIVYISGNHNGAQVGGSNVALRWEPDLWDKCQVSPNLNQKVKSWKENDLNGNICLFIKIDLSVLFMREAKRTLSDFHIEFRQITAGKLDGFYRIGGTYFDSRKFLPWLNYQNNESDLLSDYRLRASLYENKTNFYPQGEDFIFWLRDRRKFYGSENNIKLLDNMLKNNSKYFCSVNILTGLLIEEIQKIREQNKYKNEINTEFYNSINEIQKRLGKKANEYGMNESWVKFALTVFTSEIYPYRSDLNDDFSGKSILGLTIKSTNKVIFNQLFTEKYNYLTPNINQPYIEFYLPGLLGGFPKGGSIENLILIGPNNDKVGLGAIKKLGVEGISEISNQEGKLAKADHKWVVMNKYNKPENFVPELGKYYFNNKVFTCFMPPRVSLTSVLLPVSDSVVPEAIKETGQTEDSMLACLEKLTDDNKNGGMILEDILAMKNTKDENELKVIYGRFIHSLKNNSRNCYHSLRTIYNRHASNKQVFDFMVDIMKEAKLSPTAPRLFFLEYKNIFSDKTVFAYMGPIDKPLTEKVESNLKPGHTYKTENSSHQFQETLVSKKGGAIYLATKITASEKTRAYLVVNTPYTSSINFTVVLNEKTLVDNTMFSNYGSQFSQNLSLSSGENILLIKLIGSPDIEWGKNISLIIGDNYGAPLKGVTYSPFK